MKLRLLNICLLRCYRGCDRRAASLPSRKSSLPSRKSRSQFSFGHSMFIQLSLQFGEIRWDSVRLDVNSCCRLSKLKILELRENHLKTLPQSLSRLTELERLDIGCNEFTELVGSSPCSLLLNHRDCSRLSWVAFSWRRRTMPFIVWPLKACISMKLICMLNMRLQLRSNWYGCQKIFVVS